MLPSSVSPTDIAQAVTFGMLMARAHGLVLANGLEQAAQQLGQTIPSSVPRFVLLADNVANAGYAADVPWHVGHRT